MFQKKTVIVVGAGASEEANLPTGSELTKKIAGLLDVQVERARQIHGDTVIWNAIHAVARRDELEDGNIATYRQACLRIRDAMPQAMSIDSFIDAHRGDSTLELCGKLAIVRSILQAEQKSSLFFDPNQIPAAKMLGRLDGTWFKAFMQLLSENSTVEELEERLAWICIVDFNYDRCIEHFLINAIQNYYYIDSEQAAELVRGIEIYHPYGTVGTLPWYDQEHAIAFGAEPSPDQLLDLAGQTKTFTEGTDPSSSDIEEIRAKVAAAQIILFLGFAYHPQNVDLVSSAPSLSLPKRQAFCYGTAMHISESNCELIAHELAGILNVPMSHIALRSDLTCGELFREYWRSLAWS